MTSAAHELQPGHRPRRPGHGGLQQQPPLGPDGQAPPLARDVGVLRASTAAQVPSCCAAGCCPPERRVLITCARWGWAILAWRLVEKRRANRLGPARDLPGRPVPPAAQGVRTPRADLHQAGPDPVLGRGRLPARAGRRVPAAPRPCATPRRSSDVRKVVEADLGRPLEEVFEHFEPRPIAAASIAQVHAARLRTGEEVVVKVQRPQVAGLVERDIAAMSWLAPHLIGRIPVATLANPPALVRAVRRDDRRGAGLPPRGRQHDGHRQRAGPDQPAVRRRTPAPPRAGDPPGARHGTPGRLRLGRRRGHAPGRDRHLTPSCGRC